MSQRESFIAVLKLTIDEGAQYVNIQHAHARTLSAYTFAHTLRPFASVTGRAYGSVVGGRIKNTAAFRSVLTSALISRKN